MEEIQLNVIAYDTFVVINPADSSLVSGLVDGNFTKELYNHLGAEVSGVITVTITELGNGKYRLSWTSNAEGPWSLTIYHPTYLPTGVTNDYTCVTRTSDIDDILADTNEMQGKLPTNEIMGSSTKADKDDEIDEILLDTGTTIPAQITSDHVVTDALITSEHSTTDALVVSEHVVTDALITSEHVTTRVAITTSETNIRGADSDTLKTISEQIDALPDDADITTVMGELTKILGLLHFNYYVDNVVTNTVAGITTETHRIRVYSDKDSVGTDNDVVLTLDVESKYGLDKIIDYYKGVDGS